MDNNIAMEHYPDILIVYSNNILAMEQVEMFEEVRTIVLVCCKDVGFAGIAKKAPQKGYVTIKKWKIEHPGAVSFHIPNDRPYKLDVRLLPEMLARYERNKVHWETVCKETRYHGIIPLPR